MAAPRMWTSVVECDAGLSRVESIESVDKKHEREDRGNDHVHASPELCVCTEPRLDPNPGQHQTATPIIMRCTDWTIMILD